MSKNIIALLPKHVANQIAAGEVIQRPSSIVKELIENSIDSKATKIQLIIKEAGKTLIQVVDNGIGMSPFDLPIAFERHTTSKIKKANDLFKIKTKGFRGEALASISAISHITAISRQLNDEMATCIKISGNKVESKELVIAEFGTSISVNNLFFNIPARRKFLKSNMVELKHIIDEFNRLVISHNNIHFSFFQNNNEIFNLIKTDLKKRIIRVFGAKFSEILVPVKEDTPVVKINGFIIKPSGSKKTRGQQFFFINKRYIKSPFLHHAVNSAFEGILSSGYFPGYFIFFEIDPNKIDINIHPTKTEVKFEDEQSIYAILRSSIKHSLGIFQVSPTLDFDKDSSMDTPYSYRDKSASIPPISLNKSFNPFNENNNIYNIESNDGLIEMDSDSKQTQEIFSEIIEDFVPQQVKVFQLFNKYLVSALPSGLLIINQRRAHQRILYEKFLASLSEKDAPSQQLLFPFEIKVSDTEYLYFTEQKNVMEAMGFKIDLSNSKVLKIIAIPVLVDEQNLESLVEKFLSDDPLTHKNGFSLGDTMAKRLCKALSIPSGKTLTIEEQQSLLASLFACKEKLVSPFNRQILVNFDAIEIEKRIN